jgi:hypothetical protein
LRFFASCEAGKDLFDGFRSSEYLGKKNSLTPAERNELAHGFAFVAAEIVDAASAWIFSIHRPRVANARR